MTEGKIYYSIKEVSEEFKITAPTLRYWETQFPTLKPQKNRRGVRLYRKQDIDIIRKIVYLTRIKGYSLEGARKEIAKDRICGDEDEVLQTLLDTKQFLLKLKQQLS